MSTRERIVDAARAIFTDGGLQALSVRKVAAAVGLSPMALYRHFAGMDELIDALVMDGLEAWRARLAATPDAEPEEWLTGATDAFLDFALEEPRRFEAAFLLRGASARRYPEDFREGRSPPVKLITDQIRRAQAEGALGDAPPEEIGLSIWAMAQGLVSLWRAGRFSDEAAFRQVYHRALRRTLQSFATMPGKGPS
jgi:AcrR family transcriptional regulator